MSSFFCSAAALAVGRTLSTPSIASGGAPDSTGAPTPIRPAISITEWRDRSDEVVPKPILGEEDVEPFGDGTVGDMPERMASIGCAGPAGAAENIRIRGTGNGGTRFVIDGKPAAASTGARRIEVDRRSADLIEGIEILRSRSAAVDAEAAQSQVECFARADPEPLRSCSGYLTAGESERRRRAENERRGTPAP